MSEAEIIQKKGSDAVKKLRFEKLKNGNPFMINSNDLPTGQCYLEYPDGKITLVRLSENSLDFTLIRELADEESKIIRTKYQLESFNG